MVGITDYFEETFALANSLILNSVSEPMWEIFFDVQKVGLNEGAQLFVGEFEGFSINFLFGFFAVF